MGYLLNYRRRVGRVLVTALGLCMFWLPSATFAGGSDSFALNWKKDIAIGGGAASVFICGRIATTYAPESAVLTDSFDDDWTLPYNSLLDSIGDAACFTPALALPLLLDRWDLESASTIAVMYAECMTLAIGTKDVLKAIIRRPRPYLSYSDTPEELLSDDDRYFSFPSGHTTIAFATAAFSTYVFSRGPTSPMSKWLLGASTFTVAGGVAASRIAAGVHYPTDVLAGAVIGSLIGVAVPWLHAVLPNNVQLGVGTNALWLVYSF